MDKKQIKYNIGQFIVLTMLNICLSYFGIKQLFNDDMSTFDALVLTVVVLFILQTYRLQIQSFRSKKSESKVVRQ